MINPTGSLVTAWYNLLNGNVGYTVYKEDAPENTNTHYVLLRAEGGVSENNKRSFAEQTVVIVDIVTVFENNVDRSVVETIDNTICGLILPTMEDGLTDPSGVEIRNVIRENFDYPPIEQDGVKKYYRKISRWAQYVHQTA